MRLLAPLVALLVLLGPDPARAHGIGTSQLHLVTEEARLVGTYTLRFQSGSLTPVTSGSITLGPGAPAELDILTQPPQSAENGKEFDNNVVVRVQDASGNNISDIAVTAGVASGAGALSGTTTRTTGGNGRATFNDLELNGLIGAYTLNFSTTGGLSVISRSITLTAGPPAALVIQTQPSSSAKSGVTFDAQPVIGLTDAGGNPVRKKDVRVFAILETLSGVGTLQGTASILTNNDGVASFSGLRITGTGTFRIRFSSSGLSGITSIVITVSLL